MEGILDLVVGEVKANLVSASSIEGKGKAIYLIPKKLIEDFIYGS